MSRITILTLVLGVLLAAAILAIVILLVKVGQLARQIAEFPQRVKDVKAGPRASLTGNQRRIRDAIA